MSGFLEHYLEIVASPAHLAAELTFIIVVDVVIVGILMPLLRRLVRREHNRIDAEHGVINHGNR